MLTRLWKNRRLRRAQKRAARGDLHGSIAEYEEILKDKPDHAIARVHLALTLAQNGEYGAAAEEARRAAEAAPKRPGLRLLAGRVFYDAEDYAAARAEFDAVLAMNPHNVLAKGYRILTDWAAGDAEAWRRMKPEQLPDSNPFLVRWLVRVEFAMRPALEEARSRTEEGAAP